MNVAFSRAGWRTRAFLGLLLAAVSCGGSPVGSSRTGAGLETHPLVGSHAPAFSRPDLFSQRTVSLEAAKGHVLIVDFMATYCKPCEESLPKLQALVDAHGGKVLAYGVSEDDSVEGIAAFVKKTGVKFPVVWDDGNAVGQRYKLEKMPTSYIVDAKGVIRFVHSGYAPSEDGELRHEIDQLLR